MKTNKKFAVLTAVLLFTVNIIFAQSARSAEELARDALRRLDEALGGKITATVNPAATTISATPQNPAPVQSTRGGQEPRWVIDPYAVYPRDRYLATVGFGPNREEAEKKAIASLTAIFGQSIKSEYAAVTVYSEAVSKGIVSSSGTTKIMDTISSSTSLDTLIGAEIGNVWDDAHGIVYSVAYLDKERTIAVYGNMLHTNLKNIENLTAMTSVEKNTLDGYARYKLAAIIAGINAKHAEVIAQCGGPTAESLNLPGADILNIEASNIIKNVTVIVNVKGDSSNRIRDAFTKVISVEGLRTRGSSPPYTLEVNVDMSEVVFQNNNNKFCRFTISAELIENSTDSILLPFNFTDRVGHATYAGAQATAFLQAEKLIGEKYPAMFREYIDGLLPKK
jgi:hypothetical protein